MTRPLNVDRIRFHRKHLRRAPLWSWPMKSGKRLWPSYPTCTEVLLAGPQILRGQSLVFVEKETSRRSLDLKDPRILNNVLGVRADVEVPLKYLTFFEYRWNFLILAHRTKVPRGLRKFLISLWRSDRTSLWLARPTPFVSFLRTLRLNDSPKVFAVTPQKNPEFRSLD